MHTAIRMGLCARACLRTCLHTPRQALHFFYVPVGVWTCAGIKRREFFDFSCGGPTNRNGSRQGDLYIKKKQPQSQKESRRFGTLTDTPSPFLYKKCKADNVIERLMIADSTEYLLPMGLQSPVENIRGRGPLEHPLK